jgi:hypothetical protein
MADWSDVSYNEYIYPRTERDRIIDAWNEDTAEEIWDVEAGDQPGNIDWSNEDSSERTTRLSLARNSSKSATLEYEPESYKAIS